MVCMEAWITVAVDDKAALNALILAESLKRSKTTRKLVVVFGTSVSESYQGRLSERFDAVVPTDSRNKNVFEDSVFAHVLCLSVPLLRKCIYLDCNVVVLRNADHLFELDVDEGLANLLPNLDGNGFQQPSLVLFTPSEKIFKSTLAYLNSDKNNSNNWFLGKGMTPRFDEYCCSITPDSNMVVVTNPKKLSFVHFVEKQTEKNIWICDNSLEAPFKKEACEYLDELRRAVVNPTENDVKMEKEKDVNDPIAIVGMACRFAGCSNKEEYWDMLMAKKRGVRTVPENRWPIERFPDIDPGCWKAKASFLDPIDEFDGKFFGMSPYELEYADPQQRMMLEVLWEALEDAAINPQSLGNTNTGIFTGTWLQTYRDEMSQGSHDDFFRGYMGNSFGASAGRLSHFLGTTGPCIATESGCSSSMVAVGIGINKLRNKTELALCCGVNLLTGPFNPEKFSITSPSGFCKTFDANADGFGRGEGCGVLVLKRLSDAVRDNDRVYALIQGYGEAQEGPSASLGTPTVAVEAQAMQLALKDAGIEPWEVSYVEAHGTGTQVGDPLEFAAITRVYSSPKRVEPLIVASVKPNIGHTESCSGIAAIIKTALALVHEEIPPHIGCVELNPRIDLNALPAIIPMDSVPWKRTLGTPRKAGVSNFGITGTDAHLILEEAPEFSNLTKMLPLPSLPLQILSLSAKSEEALNALLDSYQKYLQGCPPTTPLSLSDVTFTANTGRGALSPWRAAVIGKDCAEVLNKIEKQSFKSGSSLLPGGGCPKIVMTFSGQGNYYFGMGNGLYEAFPTFRQHMDHCFTLLNRETGLDLKTLMWVEDPTGRMQFLQSTASLCVQYCTFKLWESWGVKPDIVLGHSVGEFVAAVAAGFLTVEEAVKLAIMRQHNISSAKGKMLAVGANFEVAERLKKEVESRGEDYWLDYCCFNAPSQIVIGGPDGAIAAFEEICKKNEIKTTIINPVLALHTRALNNVLTDFRKHFEEVKYGNPTCTYVSATLGRILEDPAEINADYWVKNLSGTVQFSSACLAAYNEGARVCLDIAPHPILATLFSTNVESMEAAPEKILCVPSLRKNHPDVTVILESLAALHVAGVNVDWVKFHEGWAGEKISLPSYPFQRKVHWFPVEKRAGFFGSLGGKPALHPLLGYPFPTAASENIFQSLVLVKDQPFLEHHMIGDHIIFPGAGFLEMALAGGHGSMMKNSTKTLGLPLGAVAVKNFKILAALRVDAEEGCELQTVVGPPNSESGREIGIYRKNYSIESGSEASWILHASAEFSQAATSTAYAPLNLPSKNVGWTIQPNDSFYETLDNIGLKFGSSFRTLQTVWRKGADCIVELAELSIFQNPDTNLCHPACIDAMIQALVFVNSNASGTLQLEVPIAIGSFTWVGKGEPRWILVKGRKAELYGKDKQLLAIMQDVDTIPTTVADISRSVEVLKLPQMFENVWLPNTRPDQLAFHNPSSAFNLRDYDFSEFIAAMELEVEELLGPDYISDKRHFDMTISYFFIIALHDLGWNSEKNDIFDVDDWASNRNIPSKNIKMLRRFFEMLTEDGYLSNVDEKLCFKVCKALPTREELVEMMKSNADMEYAGRYSALLSSCMERFVPIVQGKESALSILFPGEANKISAETAYRDSITCRSINSLLSKVLSTVIPQSSNDTETLRILEVGAGTGSATSVLFPILKECGIPFVYTYTDLSPAFFLKAEAEFEGLQFQVLDIEKDPLGQGFSPAQFDLVLASNVLHATQDLKTAVANCRLLTRGGGKLVILEHFRPDRIVDAMFGLLDGYWRFTDYDIRPWHTIVDYPIWEQTMKSVGYVTATSATMPDGAYGVVVATAHDNLVSCIPTMPIEQRPSWLLLGPESDLVESLKLSMISCGRTVCKKITDVPLESLEGVVYLWGTSPESPQSVVAKGFLDIIQQLSQTAKSKVVVVTMGGVGGGDTEPVNPTAGSLWGMTRTLRHEFPAIVKAVDIQSDEDVRVHVFQILSEMWSSDPEMQIIYRDQGRICLRGNPTNLSTTPLALPNDTRFCLQLSPLKTIEALSFRAMPAAPILKPEEVEVRVECAALNFKDVLVVLKPVEEFNKSDMVGEDLVGVIVSIGSQVTRWKVGDAVMGFNKDHFAPVPSHFTAVETTLMKLPQSWTFAEGACLPTVFCTVYHSLVDVAKIQRGETLLLHAASGGVGICAIQFAKQLGFKIVATAGSRRKRAFLRNVMGLEHVFHSRNLSFGDGIVRATEGRGVDVVLNSLTSPGFKETTLQGCSNGARFIELSKLNIWTDADVKQLRPDVKYSIVDLSTISSTTCASLTTKFNEWLGNGWIQRIPHTRFDASTIRDALEYMQKARHIGKIVVEMPKSYIERGIVHHPFPLFYSRSTYLITGGLGGIGFEVAKWMITLGAETLVLVGRRGPSPDVQKAIDELTTGTSNLQIVCLAADIGLEKDTRRVLFYIAEHLPPLRGIFHSAGNLSDALLVNQSWSKFGECYGPKVDGSWLLHSLSLEMNLPLDHFVLFSSVVAIIGVMGQSSHASANSYMDALAHYRHSLGLPALTINWGQWGQVGVAANISIPGLSPFSPTQGLASLELAIRSNKTQVAIAEVDIDYCRSSTSQLNTYFTNFKSKASSSSSSTQSRRRWELTSAQFWELYDQGGISVMETYVSKGVAGILKLDEGEKVDLHRNFGAMGFDSLMMIELKNSLQTLVDMRVKIGVDKMADFNTVGLLAGHLADCAKDVKDIDD